MNRYIIPMDCINCEAKICRKRTSCNQESFSGSQLSRVYLEDEYNQKVIQSSAVLVDHGRAGTLSRLEEIAEFVLSMGYKKVGLAYCYGMEAEAKAVKEYLEKKIDSVTAISCSIGALAQSAVNQMSAKKHVACNPIGQAEELNNAGVDFAVVMGLCLGHDILFQKNIRCDFTTLVVKDRKYHHNPMEQIRGLV